ncbi:hypothetical protein BC332_17065 [Capsicum chinense]|nr:hypothetical protein BC332_17065 [Capsicum chinense]
MKTLNASVKANGNTMPPLTRSLLQITYSRVTSHTAVNSFPDLVYTARQTMGVGHARSHYLNRKEEDAEGRASDWSEVITSLMFSLGPDPEMWIIQGTLAWHTSPIQIGVWNQTPSQEDRWGDSGVYFSEELKFAIKLGYTVILLKGYLFEKGSSQKFFLEVNGEGALVSATLHNLLVYRFPKMKRLSSNWLELIQCKTDGASRGNPGKSGVAVVFRDAADLGGIRVYTSNSSSGIPPAGDITWVLLDIALKNLFDSQFPKRFPGITFYRFVNEVYIFIRKNEKVLFDDKAGYALLEELGLRGKIESIGPGDDPLPP